MTGVILAGGGNTRFGSFKGAAEIGDEQVLARVISQVRAVAQSVYLNGPDELESFGCPIINDEIQDQGPLHGIHSCYNIIQDDLLVLSCDMPFITASLLKRLINDHQSACFRMNNKVLPFPGVFRQPALNALADFSGDQVTEFVTTNSFSMLQPTQLEALQLQAFNTKPELEKLAAQSTKFRLHGQLADLFPQQTLVVPTPENFGIEEIRISLANVVTGIGEYDFQLAMNGQLVTKDTHVIQGSTIEVMPPFSGG